MFIATRNYDDFRVLIDKLCGGKVIIFFGRDQVHANETIVYATDAGCVVIMFVSVHGLPDEFHNNFPTATALAEISRLEWKA